MSRKQGPQAFMGMRPAAIAVIRRQGNVCIRELFEEAEA